VKLFWIGLGLQRVGMSLFMTLYMLYLTLDLGLSFGLAMSLNIVYMGLAIPLEVVTGWIGDRFGHRNSVVIGLLFEALSCLVYACAQNFGHAVIAESLFAVGSTCISGSDRAFLGKGLSKDVFSCRWSRFLTVTKVLAIFGSMLGAWVGFQIEFRLVFGISLILVLMAAFFALSVSNGFHSRLSGSQLTFASYKVFVKVLWGQHRRFLVKAFLSSVLIRSLFALWPVVLADFGDGWVVITGSVISVGIALGFSLVRIQNNHDYSQIQFVKGIGILLMVLSITLMNPLGFVVGLFL
jgi:MFS family permease